MFGVTVLIENSCSDDPELQCMELFQTLDDVLFRANHLMDEFSLECGSDEDSLEPATRETLLAVTFNDDLTWRAYIAEIKE